MIACDGFQLSLRVAQAQSKKPSLDWSKLPPAPRLGTVGDERQFLPTGPVELGKVTVISCYFDMFLPGFSQTYYDLLCVLNVLA